MAKIHIDILTPKYALFMKEVIRKLSLRNEVMVTSRDYSELNQIIKDAGIKSEIVGKHGAEKAEKLENSLERSLALMKLYDGVDAALAQAAPETARVAYGLGVPYFMTHDSPHAEAQSRLTVPLAKAVLTPFPIKVKHWKIYGAKEVIKYHSLDPMAWIGWASALPSPVSGLDAKKGLVVVREEEYQASYLEGKKANTATLAAKLSDMGFEVVFLPRYGIKKEAGNALVVSSHPIMAPLLKAADAFIGAGGTMNTEAVLLGTPTYSVYPGEPTDIERYLMQRGLVKKASEDELISHFQKNGYEVKREKARFSKIAAKIRESMVDPTDFLVKFVEESLKRPAD